jgi:hypothetical protein
VTSGDTECINHKLVRGEVRVSQRQVTHIHGQKSDVWRILNHWTVVEFFAEEDLPDPRFARLGMEALRAGEVAVVSLAGRAGTRWTRGAGVVKALNPFCKLSGLSLSSVSSAVCQ